MRDRARHHILSSHKCSYSVLDSDPRSWHDSGSCRKLRPVARGSVGRSLAAVRAGAGTADGAVPGDFGPPARQDPGGVWAPRGAAGGRWRWRVDEGDFPVGPERDSFSGKEESPSTPDPGPGRQAQGERVRRRAADPPSRQASADRRGRRRRGGPDGAGPAEGGAADPRLLAARPRYVRLSERRKWGVPSVSTILTAVAPNRLCISGSRSLAWRVAASRSSNASLPMVSGPLIHMTLKLIFRPPAGVETVS